MFSRSASCAGAWLCRRTTSLHSTTATFSKRRHRHPQMICILVCSQHGGTLEEEIRYDASGSYTHLAGVPKPLLPSGFEIKRILDIWWDAVNKRHIFENVYIVANANKYKFYERWATANDFPMENVVNNGTTTKKDGGGSLADIALVLRSKKIEEDFVVVNAETLFYPDTISVWGVVQYFNSKNSDLVTLFSPDSKHKSTVFGEFAEFHMNDSGAIIPAAASSEVTSESLCPVIYAFKKETAAVMMEYLGKNAAPAQRQLDKFILWLSQQRAIAGMRLPAQFHLVGQTSDLADYDRALRSFSQSRAGTGTTGMGGVDRVVQRTHSRVGIMGNPSDGFGGKTIALLVGNFWAEVHIRESKTLVLEPHPLNDPTEFGSLADLCGISKLEGYQGGLRLMQATCKRFFEYCTENGIGIGRRNFTMSYDTNIPRQVGLAGSSAICYACVKALMKFHGLTDRDISKWMQPTFVLKIENEELGINAGLQDRVVQVYEGLVYMDLATNMLEERGYGEYENLEVPEDELPQFWLAYLADPSDSGKIHNDVKIRWLNGDETVRAAMQQFAEYTEQAREAINKRDWDTLADLMDANFALRKKTYGEASFAPTMLEMIAIGQRHNAAVKFPGSGGAVVGMCRGGMGREGLVELREDYESHGYVFTLINPKFPGVELEGVDSSSAAAGDSSGQGPRLGSIGAGMMPRGVSSGSLSSLDGKYGREYTTGAGKPAPGTPRSAGGATHDSP